jgi:hypothetical protein
MRCFGGKMSDAGHSLVSGTIPSNLAFDRPHLSCFEILTTARREEVDNYLGFILLEEFTGAAFSS